MKEHRTLRSRTWLSDMLQARSIIEIADNKRVLLENHMGVIGYGKNQIRVKQHYGYLDIVGENLEILCMSHEKLVIMGDIHCVELQRRKCCT